MLTRFSRPRLSSSLERRTGEAFDRAMRRRIRLNGVAEFMMDGMDGTRSISRIAAEVSEEFGIPEDVALADTISLTEKLQEYWVVNARSPVVQSLRFAVLSLLVSGGSTPGRRANPFAWQRRVDVRGASFVGILAQVAPRVSLGLLSLAGLLALVLGWSTLALTGGLLDAVLVATSASFALVLGVSLHESAHLYALRRCVGDENLGYVRVSPLQISIVYPNLQPEKNFWVAMSGPLCPVICGVILYCVNVLYSSPLIATSALLLVAHASSYIPVPGSDGMNLLAYATGGRGGPRPDRRAAGGRWRGAVGREASSSRGGRSPPIGPSQSEEAAGVRPARPASSDTGPGRKGGQPRSARRPGPFDGREVVARGAGIRTLRGHGYQSKGATMILNKVGASLVIATLISSVLTVAAAAGITFYALASQSSVALGNIYDISVEKNGAFEVTLGAGLLLTFVLIVAVLTVVVSFVQIKVLGEGARRQES